MAAHADMRFFLIYRVTAKRYLSFNRMYVCMYVYVFYQHIEILMYCLITRKIVQIYYLLYMEEINQLNTFGGLLP